MGKSRSLNVIDDPVMSDATILISIEDLINIAMGPAEKNIVNFKMVQSILHILARQLRLLETQVELRISEDFPAKERKRSKRRSDRSSSSPSSSASPKRDLMEIKEEKKRKAKEKKAAKEKEGDVADTESKAKEKAEKNAAKEKELMAKMTPEEREQYLKEKEEMGVSKLSPKEMEQYLKQKEKEQKEIVKMSPKEKENYMKEKEKQLQEMKKMSPKERESYLKEKLKEQKELEKMSPQERELYLKEKEKEKQLLEKMSPKKREKYLKEKEKEKQLLEKMSPKKREKYLKEKETENQMLEKMSPQEREIYIKEKENEREQLEQMSPKKKEKYLKEKSSAQLKHHGRAAASGSSIAISEIERQNEKVLLVEKGPSTRSVAASKARVGSIEVVTLSQLDILKAAVKELQKVTGPVPMPALPDNKKLRSDLAQGTASLTDAMQAMQVSARVQAAEQGISRMAGLLTQLAAAGALPSEFAEQLEEVTAEIEALKQEAVATEKPSKTAQSTTAKRKSVAISAKSSTKASKMDTSTTTKPSSVAVSAHASTGAVSVTSQASRMSKGSMGASPLVTKNDMNDAIQWMKEDLIKNMNSITNKAASSAENASAVAKGVSNKLDVALALNRRISDLYVLTSEYAEQLNGFDAGLTTQMQSFQEQMAQMRSDLKAGLQQLEMVNNNAETVAVMELNERFEGLVLVLDETMSTHQYLISFQDQLNQELRSLLQAVEMLRDEKADRDEVLDGLRDKADNSKLDGYLMEEEFAASRLELGSRLDLCYDKFRKQQAVWMTAMKDMTNILEVKADIMQLLTLKDDAQDEMRDIQAKLGVLGIQLGEPKAAMLTRLLSKDGKCAACYLPSLMDPQDEAANMPPSLPALRPPPDGEPCKPQWQPLDPSEDLKGHTCKRWVGGSHTLLPASTPREAAPAPSLAGIAPVNKYDGYGLDGRLYRMEDELLPCIECNKMTTDDVKSGEEQKVTAFCVTSHRRRNTRLSRMKELMTHLK